jgi:plastocyanin
MVGKASILLVSLVAVFIVFSAGCIDSQPAPSELPSPGSPEVTATVVSLATVNPPSYNLGIPKKSAHYESNTPAHGAILAGVPVNIVIDFNFDLGPGSAISVISGGREYGTGTTTIDPNRLAMRRPIERAAPDGLYEVIYIACWPDGSCHDGNFRFAIDRSLGREFTDLTGNPRVTISMNNISFEPARVRISRGTNVTWINLEAVEHFVNTESHPSHTYYLLQNSRGLLKNDTFSVIFDTPGIYPYHCSAHAAVMTGIILVE